MADSNTDLQREIIREAAESPSDSHADIARKLDSSGTYVSKIRREYQDEINKVKNAYSAKVAPTFGQENSIFLSDDLFNRLDISRGDIIKVTFETEEDSENTYEIRYAPSTIADWDSKNEVHSLFYILFSIYPDIPKRIESLFSRFEVEDSDELGIFDTSALENYINNIYSYVDGESQVDLIIGANTVPVKTQEDFTPENSISFPTSGVSIQKPSISKLLSHQFPKIKSIDKYEGGISKPDRIYFTHYGELSDDDKSQLKSKILNFDILDRDYSYSIGDGPTANGPVMLEPSDPVVVPTEDNIRFVERKARSVRYNPSVDISSLREIFEKEVRIDTDQGQITPDIHNMGGEGFLVDFKIESASATGTIRDDSIFWIYPSDIRPLSQIADEISREIAESKELDYTMSSEISFNMDYSLSSKWIFDTNALYHQIVNDEPSSILRTFIPNMDLFDSDILLPWVVLYEINKHKDSGSAPPRAQENGLENIRTLRILDEHDFINLSIGNIPEEINGNPNQSDVADMYILQRAQADNATLISGDQRLLDIAEISDTDAVDIVDYAQVSPDPSTQESIEDDVLSNIGKSLTSESEIFSAIEESATATARPDSAAEINPDDYLSEWLDNQKVIKYVENDEIKYERAEVRSVVITPAVVSELCSQIDNGSKLFNGAFLRHMKTKLGVSSPSLPHINFVVPMANILSPQSLSMGGLSTEARELYYIEQAKNAGYQPVETQRPVQITEHVHDAVVTAREQGYPLLCADTDSYLSRIGRLLSVRVLEFDRGDIGG